MLTAFLALSLALGAPAKCHGIRAAQWVPEEKWNCTCCYYTKDGRRVCYKCPC